MLVHTIKLLRNTYLHANLCLLLIESRLMDTNAIECAADTCSSQDREWDLRLLNHFCTQVTGAGTYGRGGHGPIIHTK